MKVAGLGVVSLRLQGIHLHTESRIRHRGCVLLRHEQLALLLEPRASVPLTQDLDLGPVCGELLRDAVATGWGQTQWAAGPGSWKTPGEQPVSACMPRGGG
jgi:hypothetical protein